MDRNIALILKQQKEILELRMLLVKTEKFIEWQAYLIGDWGQYASKYFQEKHGLDDDVKKCLTFAKNLRNRERVRKMIDKKQWSK